MAETLRPKNYCVAFRNLVLGKLYLARKRITKFSWYIPLQTKQARTYNSKKNTTTKSILTFFYIAIEVLHR